VIEAGSPLGEKKVSGFSQRVHIFPVRIFTSQSFSREYEGSGFFYKVQHGKKG
jgi:hypothetical protein